MALRLNLILISPEVPWNSSTNNLEHLKEKRNISPNLKLFIISMKGGHGCKLFQKHISSPKNYINKKVLSQNLFSCMFPISMGSTTING
jgi:hypothetical protein